MVNSQTDRSVSRNGSGNNGGQRSLMQSIRSFLGRKNEGPSLRESLEEVIEEHVIAEEDINPEERTMLMNVLSFGKLTAEDVMVPRADIVAVESTTSMQEVIRKFGEAAHSRMPIYRETLDDVIGMVHVKDILKYWSEAAQNGVEDMLKLQDVRRDVLFVAPSMPVADLLMQMRATRIHMALVVDEFGGIDGLATTEDVIEEIIGEIEDEHDSIDVPMIVEGGDGVLYVDARLPLEEFEERMGIARIAEDHQDEIDTVGGLLFTLAGRVPARGEIISHPLGLEFEVIDADPRRLKRLRVRRVPVMDPAS